MGSTSGNPRKENSLAVAYIQGMDPATRDTGTDQPIRILSPILDTVSDSFTSTTMSGNAVLVVSSVSNQAYNPNGSDRTVTLPAEASAAGKIFRIKHIGTTKVITVRDDTPTTIRVLAPGEEMIVCCNGTLWAELSYVSKMDVRANTQTLSGDLVLVATSPVWQHLNPNGTPRNVTLPAEADSTGLYFFVRNTASASYLVVRDDTPTNLRSVRPGETSAFSCDGTTWTHVGTWGAFSSVAVVTLAGTRTLTPSSATVQYLNPDGAARNVDLPAEADSNGLRFWIRNTGAGYALTVRDDAAATIATVNPGEWVDIICDGTDWVTLSRGSVGAVENDGVVAEAVLIFSNNPSDGDTIAIGADTYEFDNNASTTGGRIAVTIGATAADTLTTLIGAINNNGTASVIADVLGSDLRIRSANTRGGSPVGADPSIVLAESITAASNVWVQGNVNLNTLAGQARGVQRTARGQLTVTTAMITSEPFTVGSFSFTPTGFMAHVRSSTGLAKQVTDLFTISGARLVLNVDGATNVANGDVVSFIVWE